MRSMFEASFSINFFPDPICAVHQESSRQFSASVFGTPNVLEIHGTLTTVACSSLVLHARDIS